MMLQIKPVNQTMYKVYADREYLLQCEMSGKVTVYAATHICESRVLTEKSYEYIHIYPSLDNALHCIYEWSEKH